MYLNLPNKRYLLFYYYLFIVYLPSDRHAYFLRDFIFQKRKKYEN